MSKVELERALREATRALRVAEQRIRLATRAARDYGIVLSNADGLVVTWNASAQRMFGYPRAEIVGRPIRTLFPEEAGVDVARKLDWAESWCVRKDLSRFPAAVAVSDLCSDACAPCGLAVLIHDLSGRIRSEAELCQDLNAVAGSRMTPRRANATHWIPKRMARWGASIGLTAAEMAIAQLLILGMSNKEIARARGVSLPTVRTQVSSCFEKAMASSRSEFAFYFFGSIESA
jgi:PAS domain S-box-containing protein